MMDGDAYIEAADGLAVAAFACRGQHFAKSLDQPLPGHLPLLVGQAPGGVQVVRVDGVQAAIDLRRDGHGAAGRGQVDDFRAVARVKTARLLTAYPSCTWRQV